MLTKSRNSSECVPDWPLILQAKQALGVGKQSFEPISLERYRRTLSDADRFAEWLRGYERLLKTFQGDLTGTGAVRCVPLIVLNVKWR